MNDTINWIGPVIVFIGICIVIGVGVWWANYEDDTHKEKDL